MKTAVSLPYPGSPTGPAPGADPAALASDAIAAATATATAEPAPGSLAARVSAYVSLTKPRLTVMVLVTVAAGFVVAGGSGFPLLLAAVVGAGLVAGGAGAWNMAIERDLDRLMRRTARRAVPAGVLTRFEAAAFGSAITLLGLAILALGANALAAAVALATFVLYVAVYTPLKTRTTLNTAVGAIPGALPPVIGWAAARGEIGLEALVLFLIVFLWQFPHFLAIAWIHRADYARAGYRMLPSVDPEGRITARQSVIHALALLPVGLLPTLVGLAGYWYHLGALILGLVYLAAAVEFLREISDANARKLLRASFLYLPLVLLLLLVNVIPR